MVWSRAMHPTHAPAQPAPVASDAAVPDPADYLPLTHAARLLPATRGRVRASTLWRWSRRGLRAADDTVVRLRTHVLGGVTVTTRRWLAEFAAALAAARDHAHAEADRAAACPDRTRRPSEVRS